jgi:hypothetical protein
MKSTGPAPDGQEGRPRGRRVWLIVLLTALALATLFWLTRRGDPRPAATTKADPNPATSHPNRAPGPANRARSTADLKLARADNILPDHRTAKEQKDEIVKQWGEFLNAEKARLGAATFDPLAKRWLERPRLQALIEEWKSLEQAWPERSEQERDGQLPRIRAMWTEAMTEFAAELGAAGHPTTLPEPR